MSTQRERLLSRDPAKLALDVARLSHFSEPNPSPDGVALQHKVTVACDRCRRPMALMMRAPLKMYRPYRVQVTGYGRRLAGVRFDPAEGRFGGWSLICRAHRDGRPYGPVGVSAESAREVYDRAVREGISRVPMSCLAGRRARTAPGPTGDPAAARRA